MRTCCVCGARRRLQRYRAAEIRGGLAQWVCIDVDACAARVGPLRLDIGMSEMP